MKKIYNNLSIENLMKTEKFNQFDEYEQEQIKLGILAKVDITRYANKEFLAAQMEQIRLGLKDNLDVSVYAKPEFSYEQMEKIRLELKDNLESERINEKNI